MIDLFQPPKIEHKNAVKVKGYASLGDKVGKSFDDRPQINERKEKIDVMRQQMKVERIAELRNAMIESRKNYAYLQGLCKVVNDGSMRGEMLKARRDMENRIRAYKRASV